MRLVLVPLLLFLGVVAVVFTLAELHLAKPGLPSSGSVRLGDPYKGQIIFSQKCAGCHGQDGKGGTGPKLAGTPFPLTAAKAQIDNGGSVMPAGLVSGSQERDVLAYLATILKSP